MEGKSMNHEEKVVSLELARKLQELKITEGMETEWVWWENAWGWDVYYLSEMDNDSMLSHSIPAPDLLELYELLPDKYYVWREHCGDWNCFRRPSGKGSKIITLQDKAVDAAAKMLIALERKTNSE
jgi:hypothetical protein